MESSQVVKGQSRIDAVSTLTAKPRLVAEVFIVTNVDIVDVVRQPLLDHV